jgi:NAD(P)-dependent dehydrogenase (short-subunit alcohol dehydrogenase family)
MTTDDGGVALVTGATSGIGLATAVAFARRGLAVVLAGRDAERGARALGEVRGARADARAEFVRADVADPADVERLVAAAVERFGRLDVAVNNASDPAGAIGKRTADYTVEEFDAQHALNLRSVWLCMKHEIAQMLRQGGGGAIVNVSSVNGLGGVRGAALYASAKAGVLALTKSAAQEYAADGVRVNALVPGAFDTPMLRGAMAAQGAVDDESLGAMRAAYAGLVPLGRIGDPSEAAEAVVWLCSAHASYVTGHSMIVDGGMTAWAR